MAISLNVIFQRRTFMSILSNTVSICQFQVAGSPPAGDLFEWAATRLAKNSFQPIDQTAAESSFGWVHSDDPNKNTFTVPRAFSRDHYLAFTLRRDQRRVPSTIFRNHIEKAESDFLAANPGLRRVPKQEREELREAVRGALFAKTLPAPATYDVVWDTRTGLVTFTSLSPKVWELFENHFKNTFDGLRLVMIDPFSRAQRVVSDNLRPALEKANRAATGDVLDLIKDNEWLGSDFLLWLLYQTMTESSGYAVSQSGPAREGEPFVAYLNDRLILLGGGEGVVQKVSTVGPQDRFSEVCAALQDGKQITEATLYLEKEEDLWKMTLKGMMFHFASFKCPPVKIEKDNLTDETNEREAVFYERMDLLEKGLQFFDSLYAAFLDERLGKEWTEKERNIRKWLASDKGK
jgi:hypothetical protein